MFPALQIMTAFTHHVARGNHLFAHPPSHQTAGLAIGG